MSDRRYPSRRVLSSGAQLVATLDREARAAYPACLVYIPVLLHFFSYALGMNHGPLSQLLQNADLGSQSLAESGIRALGDTDFGYDIEIVELIRHIICSERVLVRGLIQVLLPHVLLECIEPVIRQKHGPQSRERTFGGRT